jgi:hypothetical protein
MESTIRQLIKNSVRKEVKMVNSMTHCNTSSEEVLNVSQKDDEFVNQIRILEASGFNVTKVPAGLSISSDRFIKQDGDLCSCTIIKQSDNEVFVESDDDLFMFGYQENPKFDILLRETAHGLGERSGIIPEYGVFYLLTSDATLGEDVTHILKAYLAFICNLRNS